MTLCIYNCLPLICVYVQSHRLCIISNHSTLLFREVKSLNLYIQGYIRPFLYKFVLYVMVESCVILTIYVV